MTRRAAKVDRNQPEIVAALRKLGVTVQPLHQEGGGVPDLLTGGQRRVCCPHCSNPFSMRTTDLIEVKDGAKPPSARKLTPAQIDWHGNWRGSPVHVVTSIEEAVAAVLGLRDG